MSMTNPITPPPELVEQWHQEADSQLRPYHVYVAIRAARWGADQELEACCEWFQEFYKTESWVKHDLKHFRAARRPKPPSLKEQALHELNDTFDKQNIDYCAYCIICQALEALPND